MLATILLSLLLQGQPHKTQELHAKLDEVYKKQLSDLSNELDRLKNAPRNLVGKDAKIAAKKQEYDYIKKNYTITIPMFDFNNGVQEGDIGTIGYYHDTRIGQRIPDGRGGTVFIPSNSKTVRQGKIGRVAGDQVNVKLIPSIGQENYVMIIGLPKDSVVEDKIISLNKYIYSYKGKSPNTTTRIYEIVGDDNDFNDWKKTKLKK